MRPVDSTRSIRGRTSLMVAFVLVLAIPSLSACGGGQKKRSGLSDSDALVLIDCSVADAEVWIDNRLVAHVGDLRGGVAIPAGRHRLEVRHDQYHAFYALLDLQRGERKKVLVELAESLP